MYFQFILEFIVTSADSLATNKLTKASRLVLVNRTLIVRSYEWNCEMESEINRFVYRETRVCALRSAQSIDNNRSQRRKKRIVFHRDAGKRRQLAYQKVCFANVGRGATTGGGEISLRMVDEQDGGPG